MKYYATIAVEIEADTFDAACDVHDAVAAYAYRVEGVLDAFTSDLPEEAIE